MFISISSPGRDIVVIIYKHEVRENNKSEHSVASFQFIFF